MGTRFGRPGSKFPEDEREKSREERADANTRRFQLWRESPLSFREIRERYLDILWRNKNHPAKHLDEAQHEYERRRVIHDRVTKALLAYAEACEPKLLEVKKSTMI